MFSDGLRSVDPAKKSNSIYCRFNPGREGGGVLPSKVLLGMCRWMGLYFHNWTDYNGVTFLTCFSRVTRMGSQIFEIFGIRKFW